MKNLIRFAVAMLIAVHAAGAVAQKRGPRAGQWEFILTPQYADSMSKSGSNGSSADVQGSWGFGFGVNYNFSNRFAIGGEFLWNEADYNATFAPGAGNPNSRTTVSGTLETSTFRMNAIWNFLESDFTPFVSGGLGSTWVDTNIPNGPPINQCWWDPWYGYYCGSYVPTRSDTYFSYNAGAGLRWDVDRNFFVRAAYVRQWIDVGGSFGTPAIDQYRIDFGFKY